MLGKFRIFDARLDIFFISLLYAFKTIVWITSPKVKILLNYLSQVTCAYISVYKVHLDTLTTRKLRVTSIVSGWRDENENVTCNLCWWKLAARQLYPSIVKNTILVVNHYWSGKDVPSLVLWLVQFFLNHGCWLTQTNIDPCQFNIICQNMLIMTFLWKSCPSKI